MAAEVRRHHRQSVGSAPSPPKGDAPKLRGDRSVLTIAPRLAQRLEPSVLARTHILLRSRRAVALAALAPIAPIAPIAALSAPAAHGAWSAPHTLARPAAADLRAVANDEGLQAFVWTSTSKRAIRNRAGSGLAGRVRARVRNGDGRLGRPQSISVAGRLVASPAIGLDARGNATAVWTQAGRRRTIMVAVRRAGARFSSPFVVGRTGRLDGARPALAVAPDGAAVIAWQQGHSLQVVRRPAEGCLTGRGRGCFGAPARLPAGYDHTVAIGPTGTSYVAWAAAVRRDGRFHTVLRLAVAGRGSPMRHSRPITRPIDGDASQPAIAVLGDGSSILAWRSSLPSGPEQNLPAAIKAAVRDPQGAISARQTVSQLPGSLPKLAANPRGEAVLAWNQLHSTPANPDGPEIAAALRPASAAAFQPAATISAAASAAGSSSLAVDRAGTTILVYSTAPGGSSGPGPFAVSHVLAPGGAAFDAPLALPADFTGAVVLAGGERVSAVSGGSGGRTLLSDWTP